MYHVCAARIQKGGMMDHKVGVIPFDISGERIAVMFVTSQRRGRWILPKGDVVSGESLIDGASREAFQEAGVEGEILQDVPMTMAITKSDPTGISQVAVTYFPMLVTNQMEEWPEQDKRDRHWALLEDAPKVTDREDFQQVIGAFTAIKPLILGIAKDRKSAPQGQPKPER